MKSLFIILLAGCAVRSDDNNYYVIEMQDVPPIKAPIHNKKPFNVYWNVPTMQCATKKIHFENLFENFGIIQNDHDRFKGENITILYDPGLFPAILKNESGGKIRFRNGGVPQEGNLSKHLDEFKIQLDRNIPDKKYSGVAIIDFESWRPQFRQNFGELQPYKDVSFQIERKRHWWWKEAWIKEEAKRHFEEAARTFLQSTLSVAKKLRPLARWGYYGFPYCFNMANNNMVERCADGVPEENDEISWLWSESTALYPSVYSSVQLSTSQLVSLIRGRMREAARCAGDGPRVILPYFWYRYRDAGFLTENDLSSALSMLYKSAATGFIIWGSSNDVNTVEKCNNLKSYIYNILGPAITKYTKQIVQDEDEDSAILSTAMNTTNPTPNLDLILDPEFHWMPPENTLDLKNDIEENITKTFEQNVTNDDKTVLHNNSVLIDLILNAVLNSVNNATITTDNPMTEYDKKSQLQTESAVVTTDISIKTSTDTSQVTSSIVTNSSLSNTTNETNSEKVESQTIDVLSSATSILTETTTSQSNVFDIDKTNTNLETVSIPDNFEKYATTTDEPNTDKTTFRDYDLTSDDDEEDFYNSDLFMLLFKNETTVTFDNLSLDTDRNITTNESKVYNYLDWLLKTEDIGTSTEKNTDILTTDKSDILNVKSTEFFDLESMTENDIFKEDTAESYFVTESNKDSPHNKKYIFSESTINPSTAMSATNDYAIFKFTKNAKHNTRKSSEYDYNNNSILTTTPINLRFLTFTNLQTEFLEQEKKAEPRNVGFKTEGSESKSKESKATESINTSTTSDISKSTAFEDTEATSIVPSTEQVIY